ncbi:receptor-like protein 12 [Eutrema salsugineum]|uniref:receptor-like protein 12 n=1 Tax=Eutrema salsugineum TaxID=72664 RepID=UPI000CED0214|nr:receptor-like protein 12 [Eutrema salsugineum]
MICLCYSEFIFSSNKLSGNFPISLLNLTELSYLSLTSNQLTGTLPSNISSLSNLRDFWAYDNDFVGTIPSSLFTIPSLKDISLSNNQLDSLLEFGNISKLEWLYVDGNNLRGPIPRSVSKLVNLRGLDLSNWNTQGPFDLSIFSHLKSLRDLTLSHLNTTTTIDLNSILSCSQRLETLDLSGSHVSAKTKSSVSDPPSQMISKLTLSGCGVTEFPKIIRTLHSMIYLDISNNNIKGQVPGWLWTLPNLTYVNLSNNTFISFEIPTKQGLSSAMRFLFGSKNNFTGKIPSFICALGSLIILDLSENNFNGSIPLCMENLKSNLWVLNLRHNRLSGGLPENVFERLRSLDVGYNQLVGKLPRSLIHFSALEVLNLESNRFNDTFPFWLSSLPKLQVLVLRSNAFHGSIHRASFLQLKIMDISHNHFNGVLPSDYFVNWSKMSSLGTEKDRSDVNYMGEGTYYEDSMVLMNKGVALELVRILKIFTALDFSGNRFEGEIPRSIGLLRELHVLNLSNNAFTGHIPSSMGNLTALESLDVSQNKLSGVIPQELGNLSYLAYMNFSHNQLVGLVPGGTQFRTQSCSSFEDNSGLFGPSLDEVCKDIHKTSSQEYETPEEAEDEDEEVFSWIAAAIGFGPGIVLGLTIGYILAFYKPRWFTSSFGRNKRRSRSTTTH